MNEPTANTGNTGNAGNMGNQEKLELLKFLSNTHRTQFNERRKHEWKIVFSLLTFFALTIAANLSGKLEVPDNQAWNIFIWLVISLIAFITSDFLMDLHSANNINKEIAIKSENAVADILNNRTPTQNIQAIIPDTTVKNKLQIHWHELLLPRRLKVWLKKVMDLLKKKANNNEQGSSQNSEEGNNEQLSKGLWACRAQVLIVWLFALSTAVALTLLPKSDVKPVQKPPAEKTVSENNGKLNFPAKAQKRRCAKARRCRRTKVEKHKDR